MRCLYLNLAIVSQIVLELGREKNLSVQIRTKTTENIATSTFSERFFFLGVLVLEKKSDWIFHHHLLYLGKRRSEKALSSPT